MKKAIIVSLLFTIPALAHAAGVPKYDVNKFCDQVAKAADGSATVRNACIDAEQETYNKLKKEWQSIPEKTRDYCNKIASSVDSYQAFDECVKLEAKEKKKKKEFKY